jgi:uroporphyrinogen-III synthase
MATLLLTRPEAQSRDFLDRLESATAGRIPALIAPLFRIVPTGVPVPQAGALVFTSGRAVELAGDLTGRLAWCVGDTTADLARAAGATAVSAEGTVEDLLALLLDRADGPLIHLRGVESRGDLVPRLKAAGRVADEAVFYRTEDLPPPPEALALLNGAAPVLAPVFSPRSGRLLAALSWTAPMTVLAISERAAQPFAGRAEIEVADRPDMAAMTNLMLRRLRNLS